MLIFAYLSWYKQTFLSYLSSKIWRRILLLKSIFMSGLNQDQIRAERGYIFSRTILPEMRSLGLNLNKIYSRRKLLFYIVSARSYVKLQLYWVAAVYAWVTFSTWCLLVRLRVFNPNFVIISYLMCYWRSYFLLKEKKKVLNEGISQDIISRYHWSAQFWTPEAGQGIIKKYKYNSTDWDRLRPIVFCSH